MELKTYVHESLVKLQELGIDVMEAEQEIADSILGFPEDMLNDMEPEQILGIILSGVGARVPSKIYAFDVEMDEIEQMYTVFFDELSRITDGELEITNVDEEISQEMLEAGTGTRMVRFMCNGKTYQYEAEFQYDWFDAGILIFLNQVIGQQDTDRRLYVTTDGYQCCILFYQNEEWAQRFRELFHMELKQA